MMWTQREKWEEEVARHCMRNCTVVEWQQTNCFLSSFFSCPVNALKMRYSNNHNAFTIYKSDTHTDCTMRAQRNNHFGLKTLSAIKANTLTNEQQCIEHANGWWDSGAPIHFYCIFARIVSIESHKKIWNIKIFSVHTFCCAAREIGRSTLSGSISAGSECNFYDFIAFL